MTKIYKKDIEDIAMILELNKKLGGITDEAHRRLCHAFLTFCDERNPKLDHKRFIKACGRNTDEVTER